MCSQGSQILFQDNPLAEHHLCSRQSAFLLDVVQVQIQINAFSNFILSRSASFLLRQWMTASSEYLANGLYP